MIDDRLPLLLLPGTLCDARVFAPILPSDRSAVAADLTGEEDLDVLADAVLAAAPDRFIALGFSLGGIVALEIAARAPDRVAGMVLIATNPRAVPAAQHAERRAQILSTADPVALIGEVLWPGYVHPDRIGDSHLHEIVCAMARDCPPGTFRRQTEIALSRVDSRARMRGYTMPVLVLTGAGDTVAPSETQLELATGLPNVRIVSIPDAGHFVSLEQPHACALALKDWLAELSLVVPTPLSSTDSGILEVS